MPLALALAASVEADQSAEPQRRPHSGMIVSAVASAIILEEMGPWNPRHDGIVRRSIEPTPTTRIEQIARSSQATPGQWSGGFTRTPLRASDLQPREYAAVVTGMEHGRLIARDITIVRLTTDQEATKP